MNAPELLPDHDPFERDPALDRRLHVAPDALPLRVSAGWERLRGARADRRRARRRAWALAFGGGALAAAALLLVALRPSPGPSTWAGATLRTGGEASRVALADGSEIDALPHSELALLDGAAGDVRVALRRGGATFEVTRRPAGGRFVVEAGAVRVRVVGTRFTVARTPGPDGGRVEVGVAEGLVEVALGGEIRRLGVGERWSGPAAPPPPGAAAAPSAASSAPPSSAPPSAAAPPAPREGRPAATSGGDAPAADHPPAGDGPSLGRAHGSPRRPPEAGPTAASLLEEAVAARRARDPRGAARAYEALLERHPGDPRAPLAAFELGRIRMDALGDASGALVALRRALELGPRSPFREDALARLVRLHETLGQGQACARAKAAYLEAHPGGRYAADVARRCTTGE